METKYSKSLQTSAKHTARKGDIELEVEARGKKKKSLYNNKNFNVEQLISNEIWECCKNEVTQLKTEGMVKHKETNDGEAIGSKSIRKPVIKWNQQIKIKQSKGNSIVSIYWLSRTPTGDLIITENSRSYNFKLVRKSLKPKIFLKRACIVWRS